MRHFLFTIWNENDDQMDIIVSGDSPRDADERLNEMIENGEFDALTEADYISTVFRCELSEEEAENSGLDEI